MIIDKQLQLQIIINKLLELSCCEYDTSVILRKSLTIILKSPISSSFNNRGVIFIVENYSKLKLVAKKNIDKDIIANCQVIDFGNCICGMAAHTKQIQFTNCINHIHTNVVTSENYGHYSVPILYNNVVYGVLTLYLKPTHQKTDEELELLTTITNTLGLIIYKKRLEKFSGIIKSKLDVNFGQKYFNLLAKLLIKELGMKYCIIGKYNKENNSVTTFSFVQNNKVLQNITYDLTDTPCSTIFDTDFCYYPSNIQQLFPHDEYLVNMGIESYFGMRLVNEKNIPIGLVAMLHDKPVENELDKKEILKIFIPRLISECERKIFEDKILIKESRYKDIFHKFQDVFLRVTLLPNNESIITEITPSIYKLSGYKPSELIGKPSSIFYHKIEERNEMINILLKEKQIKNYPTTFLSKEREAIYVQLTAQLILNKKIPQEIRVVVRNITDKRNENLRKEIAYLISKKTQSRVINFQGIVEYIHMILGNITENNNFFVAIINKENNVIDFPVYYDENLKKPIKSYSRPIINSLIEFILQSEEAIIKTDDELKEFIFQNNINYTAIIPKIFISFPIKKENKVAGVMVIKSYKDRNAFTKNDIELFDFIAIQLTNILEREEWQQNIIEKEKYFRELIEKSNEVTGIINEDGIVQYVSESVKSILGYHAREIIGRNFFDFVTEKLYYEVIDNFERLVNNHKEFKIPYFIKLLTRNGEKKVIQFAINNQLRNQQIKGIVFNAQDVTEKIQNEKKLKQSQENLIEKEKNYKTIFNNANDGIIRFNQKFKIIDVNKRMCSITGYTNKELLQKTIFDLTLKEDEVKVRKAVDKLLKQNAKQLLIEKKSIHKTGKQVFCKIFIKPIYKPNKQLNYFIAFVTDITKRNEAINKALELEKALLTSGNVIYTNLDGIITFVSEKVCKTSGYTSPEVIGKSVKIFNSGYHSKEYFKNLWSVILSGKIWNGEIRNKRKDGTYFWIFGTIIPIKDISGKITHFINVRQDITELKNSRLQRVKDVIDAQEKEKENFAKELHDGLGQMLLASKMNLGAIKEEVDNLDDSTKKVYENSMKLLSDSIQEARNVSHGLMSNVVRQFGLFRAVNELIYDANVISSGINFDYNQNIEYIRFEPEVEKGIYRVIQELVANILKHSKASHVMIEMHKIDCILNIKVKDNGEGIIQNLTIPNKSLGIGLRNIETRINYLSGSFLIREDIKQGTEINIAVPILNN